MLRCRGRKKQQIEGNRIPDIYVVSVPTVITSHTLSTKEVIQEMEKQVTKPWDVKPENILLDKSGHIKISDFGLAKFGLFTVTRAQTFCGTREYMAPEIAQELPYRKNVDWWAFGVTIYEMITGYRPFFQHDEYDVLDAIVNDGVWCPEWMSSEAWSIIDAFLTKDPSERLGDPQAIKRFEFFKNINWEDLKKKRVRPLVMPKTVETSERQSNTDVIFTPVPPVWKKC